jgi:hypothetical protein
MVDVPAWLDDGLEMFGWTLVVVCFWHLAIKKHMRNQEEEDD